MMPIKCLIDAEVDWSYAVYADPPSHDFCVWIIMAELMRRHHKATAPLKVGLLLQNGILASPRQDAEQYSNQMIPNILMPAIHMMGAKRVSPWFLGPPAMYDHHISALVDAGKSGFPIPKWQVPAWATKWVEENVPQKHPIVITLRECEWQPERNSSIYEWVRFAEHIQERYPIIVVRDTALAGSLLGFPSCPMASMNAYIRAALYAKAFCNLMVCNGPNTWAIFSDAPYLIFKELIPGLPEWDHGNVKGWREQDHMEIGDQYAWANPVQRLTWKDDTFDNICAAFEEIEPLLKEE